MKSYLLLFALCIVIGVSRADTHDYVNVTRVKDQFVASYVHTTIYRDYVFGVSVSTLEAQKAYHDIVVAHDEDWSSLCLDVMLNAPLPDILSQFLPAHFLDIRVFYRVTPDAVPSACFEDAKICDDGTVVGRSGPKCEFVCPTDTICIEDVAVCADGTEVGRTGDKCEFVCPDSSSEPELSTVDYETATQAQDNFLTRYQNEYPYSKYLNGCGVTTLSLINRTQTVTLSPNEEWSGWCLEVLLLEDPSDCTFPDVYQGVRVFYSYGGICPLSTDVTCFGPADHVSAFNFFIPLSFLICVGVCVGLCCCAKRRRCKAQCNNTKVNSNGFHMIPQQEQDPNMVPIMMAPMMFPSEFDLEMMNGEQHPYESVMVPVGYPMYPPQPHWYMPPPPQKE